jgi:hypothetical protein
MNHVSALIAHGFNELHEPDGSINCDSLTGQCSYVDPPPCGLKKIPQTLDTHRRSLCAAASS